MPRRCAVLGRGVVMLFCVTLASLALGTDSDQELPRTVHTRSGAVRGSGTTVVAFKGIPYAAPPTGDRDGVHRRYRGPATPQRSAPTVGVRRLNSSRVSSRKCAPCFHTKNA
jgi:hypothetical protein